MNIAYDAGVLVAADRNDRETWADHRVRLEAGVIPITTGPVVAQASRSTQQVQLRRFLRGCDILAFTAEQAQDVGALLAAARRQDVVDAHLVLTARNAGATVLTSDVNDLRALASRLSGGPRVVRV